MKLIIYFLLWANCMALGAGLVQIRCADYEYASRLRRLLPGYELGCWLMEEPNHDKPNPIRYIMPSRSH